MEEFGEDAVATKPRVRQMFYARPMDMAPNEWNPNIESPEKFNLLAASVEDIGFSENMQVTPVGDGEFRVEEGEGGQMQTRWYGATPPTLKIIGGEHRWRVLRLAGMENDWIPCVFFDDMDEEKLKAVTVRMNLLRGELDPVKFTQLYDSLAETGHFSEQALNDMLGIASRGEFEKLYKQVKKGLPPELAAELDKHKGEIKTIEDLSKVLNSLFRQHGSDLQFSFMAFDFGGRQHTWVRLTKETNKLLAVVKDFCRVNRVDMNDVLIDGWRHVLEQKHEFKPSETADQSIEEFNQ